MVRTFLELHRSIYNPLNHLWWSPFTKLIRVAWQCSKYASEMDWFQKSTHSHSKISKIILFSQSFPVNICLFNFINRNANNNCVMCLNLAIKTRERRQWRRSGVCIINFEHILHLLYCWLWACIASVKPHQSILHHHGDTNNTSRIWSNTVYTN